jgi:hypothetical protein
MVEPYVAEQEQSQLSVQQLSSVTRSPGSNACQGRYADSCVAHLCCAALWRAVVCCPAQILEWVLSYDGVNQPEPLAITAAAAALLISGAQPPSFMHPMHSSATLMDTLDT